MPYVSGLLHGITHMYVHLFGQYLLIVMGGSNEIWFRNSGEWGAIAFSD